MRMRQTASGATACAAVLLFFALPFSGAAGADVRVYHAGSPRTELDEDERGLADAVRHHFGLVNAPLPEMDGALVEAARARARMNLMLRPSELDDERGADLHDWLNRFGRTDFVIRSSFSIQENKEGLIADMVAWAKSAVREGWNYMGVGVSRSGTRLCAAIFLVWRPVAFAEIPAYLPRPDYVLLEGSTPFGLKGFSLMITGPDNKARVVVPTITGRRFVERLNLDRSGTWIVEAMIAADNGPVVTALMPITVQTPSLLRTAPKVADASIKTHEDVELALRSWTNQVREAHELPVLARSEALERVADAYAARMVKENFFGHVDPQGGNTRSRMTAANFGGAPFGENIASNQSLSRMVKRLYESPAHRRHLLDRAFNAVGIGSAVKTGPAGSEYFVVQLFAALPKADPSRPLSDAGEVPSEVWLEINSGRDELGLDQIMVNANFGKLAGRLIKRGLTAKGIDLELVGRLSRAEIESDKGGILKTFALITVKEPQELRSFSGLLQSGFNVVGGRLMRNVDKTYTALLFLGYSAPVGKPGENPGGGKPDEFRRTEPDPESGDNGEIKPYEPRSIDKKRIRPP